MMHTQICSYLESSDATRIGLVVSFDDIHVMTMNGIMICLWNVDLYTHADVYYIYTFLYSIELFIVILFYSSKTQITKKKSNPNTIHR